MSLTDTARHWFWGCALATAASRSDVNVAMPHLRGEWSPTKAILRTLEVSFMRHFHCSHAPVFLNQSDALDCGTETRRSLDLFPIVCLALEIGRASCREPRQGLSGTI